MLVDDNLVARSDKNPIADLHRALKAAIDAEAATRASADEALDERLTTAEADIDSLETCCSTNATAISELEDGVVYTTGTQTVDGVKTFIDNIIIQSPDAVKGTTPEEGQYSGILITDSEGTAVANRLGLFETAYYNEGSASLSEGGVCTYIVAYKPEHGTGSGSGVRSEVKVFFTNNGERYATCPTPPDADDNSTKIATTAWVQALMADKIATLESTISDLEDRIAALEG